MKIEPIGIKVKDIRLKMGISQRKLALRTGLNIGYISLLESGKNNSITLTTASKLAKGLGVSPSAFVDSLTIEDYDIKSFMVNDFPNLDDDSKEWVKRYINMVRERHADYKANKNDGKGGDENV